MERRSVDDLAPLAVLDSSQWPRLAQNWLQDGRYSTILREFAALTPAQAAEAGELMIANERIC
ncbi:MAG TPA: hypothetical protein VE441_00960 [Mycobacterium sp.]|nr:hypothetical protein [Mycobacterium sp.]